MINPLIEREIIRVKAFSKFISAHELTEEQLKDKEYINDLYNNFKENLIL
jgi:hypothetical protein|tara:strand:- start:9940 stop:10089 length:150 start_codon:yes stop_codon:yes gene_type:complete